MNCCVRRLLYPESQNWPSCVFWAPLVREEPILNVLWRLHGEVYSIALLTSIIQNTTIGSQFWTKDWDCKPSELSINSRPRYHLSIRGYLQPPISLPRLPWPLAYRDPSPIVTPRLPWPLAYRNPSPTVTPRLSSPLAYRDPSPTVTPRLPWDLRSSSRNACSPSLSMLTRWLLFCSWQ